MQKEPQSVINYTVHMSPYGVHNLRNKGIIINSIISLAKTQSKIPDLKNLCSETQALDNMSATMLACQLPVEDLTLHFAFLDTALIVEEHVLAAHRTTRKLRRPNGVTLGDILGATYDLFWCPELRLSRNYEGEGMNARLLPYPND
jgi:hypothetical protein